MTIPFSFVFFRPAASLSLAILEQADQAGIPAAWLPVLPAAFDPLTLLAAAAPRTQQINLGIAVVPLFLRHPVTLASQAMTMAELAPGRFRLGVGASHPFIVEGMYGVPHRKPLEHLREYVAILRGLLWQGGVDFTGKHYRVQVQLPPGSVAPRVPLMAAAIRENMFRLAGELFDGAISSWCPLSYLADVARPAMRQGAEKANRPTPPLIGAVPTIFSDNFDAVRQAAYNALGMYSFVPSYQEMFQKAGFPLSTQGLPSDELIKALFVYGDAATIGRRYQEIQQSGVVDEILINFYPAADPVAEEMAVMEIARSALAEPAA